jgi:hypothetical protein
LRVYLCPIRRNSPKKLQLTNLNPNALHDRESVTLKWKQKFKMNKKPENFLSLLVVGLVLYFVFFHEFLSEGLREFRDLNSDDTVADLLSASSPVAVRFRYELCGEDFPCLNTQDFLCGFSIGGSELEYEEFREGFDDCITSALRGGVPMETILGHLVEECSRLHMFPKPTPIEVVSPENCQAEGGNWGVRPPSKLGLY